MHPLDADIAELAARHGGVVLHRDLTRRGWASQSIRHRLRTLTRLRPGAYAVASPADDQARYRLLVAAAGRQFTDRYCLSHRAAALLWDLPVLGGVPETVDLTAVGAGAVSRQRTGLRFHGQAIDARDVAVRHGSSVTPASRTVLDCARTLALVPAVAIADAALHAGLVAAAELADELAASPRRVGTAAARRVLLLADPRCESPGESWCRVVLHELGYRIRSQPVVTDHGRFVARADFGVDGEFVLVEFDGRSKYELDRTPADVHFQEKERHDALLALGYEVVRVRWGHLHTPDAIDAMVAAAIARSRRRHGG